jgi:hypothetical protein
MPDHNKNEFVSRVALQRAVLRKVNESGHWVEPLFGLSREAITRWAQANGLGMSDPIVTALLMAAVDLRSLAARSQEHLSDEYATVAVRFAQRSDELAQALTRRVREPNADSSNPDD